MLLALTYIAPGPAILALARRLVLAMPDPHIGPPGEGFLAYRWRCARDRRRLLQMDDRWLSDMGISRDMLQKHDTRR